MGQLFRIIKIAPDANYARVKITAQWHEDTWYRNDYGIRPDPKRSDRRRDQLVRPSFPWAPFKAQPLTGDPMYPASEWSFNTQVIAAADGTYSNIACTGRIPVNDFSSTVQPPFIARQGTMAPGGSLLGGGWTYYFCVCSVDSDGKLSPPSGTCAAFSYAPGTYTATIPILSWDAGTVGWRIFGGLSATSMTWQASGTGTPATIDVASLQAITYGVPDSEFDGLDIIIKRELHGGIWGAAVYAVGAHQLTFPGCAAGGIDYAGRIVSLIGKGDGSVIPIYNARVASNTTDVLTLEGGSPDPVAAGIVAGDVFVMRSKITISGMTLTDPLWRNPLSNNGEGMVPHAEKGFVYRFIANTGAGYRYGIIDNDETSHTLEGQWIETPDSTSVGIVEEPSWLPDESDLSSPNNSDPAVETTLLVPCRNYPGSVMFIMGITRDGGGASPAEQMCPFREAYINQRVAGVLNSQITITIADSPYTLDGSVQFIHCDTETGNTSGDTLVINVAPASTLPLDDYKIDKFTEDIAVVAVNAAPGEEFPPEAVGGDPVSTITITTRNDNNPLIISPNH